MVKTPNNWALKYFWQQEALEKLIGPGIQHCGALWCMECWPDPVEQGMPKSLQGEKRDNWGHKWPGCCPYVQVDGHRSPAAMQKHMQRYHQEKLLPQERLKGKGDRDEPSMPADPAATRDWVVEAIIKDLLTFRAASRKGMRRFLQKHAKPAGGRRKL